MSGAKTTEQPASPTRGARRALLDARVFASRYGVIIALIATIAIFSALRPGVFPTVANLKAILQQAAPLAVIALGLTVVLVMGDFDLSLAGMIGLGSASAVSLMAVHGVYYPIAIAAGIGVGVLGGAVNGTLIAYIGASSFILTLASGQVMGGVEFLITGQKTMFEGFPAAFSDIAGGSFLGLSNQVYVALGAIVILYLLLEQSEVGRYMYAIGGNREAATLSGISVRVLRVVGFVIVGVCSSLAGILIASQNASQSPNSGTGYFLPAYAAAFLGASVLRPGIFTILGTVIGALFLEVIATGLTMVSTSSALVLIVQGAILGVAVLLSRLGGEQK